jgi:hypothetical protein
MNKKTFYRYRDDKAGQLGADYGRREIGDLTISKVDHTVLSFN